MRRVVLCGLALGALLATVPARPAGGPPPPSPDEVLLQKHKIATDGPALVEFVRKHSQLAVSEEKIRALVEQLGDDRFAARQAASRALVALGGRARAALRVAVKHKDPEVSSRAAKCLEALDDAGTQASGVMGSVVRVLAAKRPAGAVEALLGYLPAAQDEAIIDEVRQALAALAVRDGKAEPLLVAALKDRHAAKRAGAAVALARADAPGVMPALGKLLEDGDRTVRLEAALALAARRQKGAVAVLIAEMGRPGSRLGGLAEDLLFRLAGDKSPSPKGDGDDDRAAYRKAWEAWWKGAEAKIDLAVLEEHARVLGHTTVALLDEDEVIDLDAANRVRWRITGVKFPLDIQRLPKERVLVAEYKAHRVTERDRKGAVVWEYKLSEPLMAQRLANGNTFMANQNGTVEVNGKGEKVSSYSPPNGALILRARKLPGGDVLLVTQLSEVELVRLDRSGRQVKRFRVSVETSGGRIDLTPGGNVLVPELNNDRVVERTMEGREVRAYAVPSPVVAVALPNGHVLITSNGQKRAVELDRAGKEVWQYKRETRVTRAVRH